MIDISGKFLCLQRTILEYPLLSLYRNLKGVSSSFTPEISTLASQSRFCFASSLVSGLVLANSFPLRYTALGYLPSTSFSSRQATSRSWADLARVLKYPFGQIQLRSGVMGVTAPKRIRRNKGDSRKSSVSVIAPGSTPRTAMLENSLEAERRRWSSYLSSVSEVSSVLCSVLIWLRTSREP